jgi:hypothetical protein
MHLDDDGGPQFLKWICIGLGIFVLLLVGGNYFLVNQPLSSNMSQTSFSDVPVYGHFGAFIQPNVIVLHIRPSARLTPDNLTDFLVTVAHSTPENPLTRDLFARVALTSGWTAQYSFSGFAWKELGDMDHQDEGVRRQFILSQLCGAAGDPLMPESTLNESARQVRIDQVWHAFVAQFTAKP